MAGFLHLLTGDPPALARSVIEVNRREPGARVTVVLLEDALAPAWPPDVSIRRLGTGDLDYAGLLDLIFEHDHVVTW